MADTRRLEFVEPLPSSRRDNAINALKLESSEDIEEYPPPARANSYDTGKSASISALSRKCLSSYSILGANLQDVSRESAAEISFDPQSSLSLVLDARVRFNAWAKSIAALHPEHLRSSLDARLKDAKDIRESILRVLGDLQASLQTASMIVVGDRPNLRWSLDSLSDDEDEDEDEDEEDDWGVVDDGESENHSDKAKGEEEAENSGDESEIPERWTSELEQLFSAIEFANASLMKFSIVIRTSPARDDYLKAAARYNYDSSFKVYYINHVRDKHGATMGDRDWLIERMGTAITRRRQYLTYRKDHQGKLSRDWDEEEGDVKPGGKREHTVALTLATAYVEKKEDVIQNEGEKEGSFGSQTSYENTVVGEAAQKRTVPPPPAMAFEGIPFEYGEPFQCPYCYTEQVVINKQAWKSHVFRDLKPYVCTFKECDLKMFKSRNEWFAHELQNHRREWSCVSCGDTFANRTTFEKHLINSHKVEPGPRMEALILQSEEPVDKILPSACLFCEDWEANLLHSRHDANRTFLGDGAKVKPTGSLGQFRRHLGHHLEQLALFALPINEGEDVQDDSADDDDDENSLDNGAGLRLQENANLDQDLNISSLEEGIQEEPNEQAAESVPDTLDRGTTSTARLVHEAASVLGMEPGKLAEIVDFEASKEPLASTREGGKEGTGSDKKLSVLNSEAARMAPASAKIGEEEMVQFERWLKEGEEVLMKESNERTEFYKGGTEERKKEDKDDGGDTTSDTKIPFKGKGKKPRKESRGRKEGDGEKSEERSEEPHKRGEPYEDSDTDLRSTLFEDLYEEDGAKEARVLEETRQRLRPISGSNLDLTSPLVEGETEPAEQLRGRERANSASHLQPVDLDSYYIDKGTIERRPTHRRRASAVGGPRPSDFVGRTNLESGQKEERPRKAYYEEVTITRLELSKAAREQQSSAGINIDPNAVATPLGRIRQRFATLDTQSRPKEVIVKTELEDYLVSGGAANREETSASQGYQEISTHYKDIDRRTTIDTIERERIPYRAQPGSGKIYTGNIVDMENFYQESSSNIDRADEVMRAPRREGRDVEGPRTSGAERRGALSAATREEHEATIERERADELAKLRRERER